eukprot:gene18869-22472_t
MSHRVQRLAWQTLQNAEDWKIVVQKFNSVQEFHRGLAMSSTLPATGKPKIAISACLLGENVRFNGGHKQSQLCSQTLADYFDFVPLCPEVAIGLGIPREPIRLVGDPLNPQAVGTVN